MESTFTLNRVFDYPEYVLFCDLGNTLYAELEQWAIAIDTPYAHNTIAHDVVEHTAAQLTNKMTSWVEEYIALGRASFIRAGVIDIASDVSANSENHTCSVLPKPEVFNTSPFTIDDLFPEEDQTDTLKCTLIQHYVNEGYASADKQWSGDKAAAYRAFSFVAEEVKEVLAVMVVAEYEVAYVNIYVDTDLEVFRPKYFDHENQEYIP